MKPETTNLNYIFEIVPEKNDFSLFMTSDIHNYHRTIGGLSKDRAFKKAYSSIETLNRFGQIVIQLWFQGSKDVFTHEKMSKPFIVSSQKGSWKTKAYTFNSKGNICWFYDVKGNYVLIKEKFNIQTI